jgi:hypothetical protein
MDNKTSACITGFVVCATLYANISATRADMHAPAADTFAFAGASAKPAVFISPLRQSTPGIGPATIARESPNAGTSAQRHFAEYLDLHRSRIETARPRLLNRAAQP